MTLAAYRMDDLYQALDQLSSQPECRECRLCEEHVGLVYILKGESERVRRHRLPILRTSSGVEYLGRVPDPESRKGGTSPAARTHGWCCAFDWRTNTCSIYNDRPLCCRIYPLDLMRLEGEVWWVVHSECPIAQRFQRQRNLDLLCAITAAMERLISDEELEQWLTQDKFSQMIEAFSGDESRVIRLRRYGTPSLFS